MTVIRPPVNPVLASPVRHYGAPVTPKRTGRTYDREIVRLAVPALGALVAEPLYLLADTAIVGNLGIRPLGRARGRRGRAHRRVRHLQLPRLLHDRGRRPPARRRPPTRRGRAAASTGCWLAAGLGLVLTVLGVAARAGDRRRDGRVADRARRSRSPTCASACSARPSLLLALAGAGYLRGMQDTKTTLVIAVLANAVNLAVELLLVYGLDLGIAGSAWGTVARAVRRRDRVPRDRRAARRGGPTRRLRPRPRGVRADARSSAATWSCAPGRCSSRSLTATAIAAHASATSRSPRTRSRSRSYCSSRWRSTRIAIAGPGDGRPVPRRVRATRDARARRRRHARAGRRRRVRVRARGPGPARPWLVPLFTDTTR